MKCIGSVISFTLKGENSALQLGKIKRTDEKQNSKERDRQTDRQTDEQTDRQTDRQTEIGKKRADTDILRQRVRGY